MKITGLANILLFFIVMEVLQGCSFPHYSLLSNGPSVGVDFTKGKWLLNEVHTKSNLDIKLQQKLDAFLTSKIADRYSYIHTDKTVLIPNTISSVLDLETLKTIKKGASQFDYVVNLYSNKQQNQAGTIDIDGTSNYYKQKENSATLTLEIYDLNTLQKIYTKSATGTSTISKGTTSDVNFTTSSDMLLLGCYKRLEKSLEKTSNY